MKNKPWLTIYWLSLAGCLVVPLLTGIYHLSLVRSYPLPHGAALVVWHAKWLWLAQPLFWVIGVGLVAIAAWSLTRHSAQAPIPEGTAMAYRLFPLSLFSLFTPFILLRGSAPDELLAMATFLIPLVSFSWLLVRVLGRGEEDPVSSSGERHLKSALAVILFGSVIFTITGLHFTQTIGAHSGDEGNYMLIAESLYSDRDMDVWDDWLERDGAFIPRKFYGASISMNSREGHRYSRYAYGLSLLAAPLVPLGAVGRHLLTGLIAGLCSGGIWLLCRRNGVSSLMAALFLFLFCASIYFVVYASRFLPEMLGATLLIWVIVLAFAQGARPWSTVLPAALCASYMPFAHPRFLPPALVGMGIYGLVGLFGPEKWRTKITRLTVFTLVCVISQAVYWVVQFRLYEGGVSYRGTGHFFEDPMGAWYQVICYRGITNVLPLFAWLIVANVVLFIRSPHFRPLTASALGLFLVTLFTSSMNVHYAGGATLPGRFLLVCLPLLVPGGAIMVQRARGPARFWCIFLGLISVFYGLVTLGYLHRMGGRFSSPFSTIAEVVPFMRGLMNPHFFFMIPTETDTHLLQTSVYVVVLLTFTGWLLMAKNVKPVGFAAGLILLSGMVIWGDRLNRRELEPLDGHEPRAFAARLAERDLSNAYVTKAPTTESGSLLELSDAFSYIPPKGLTARDHDVQAGQEWVVLGRLPVNDWKDRGYRWMTLNIPFRPGGGLRFFQIVGEADASARPVLAIRQGSKTLLEEALQPGVDGAINISRSITCKESESLLSVLLRLDGGAGRVMIDRVHWTPYSESLLESSGLTLPVAIP